MKSKGMWAEERVPLEMRNEDLSGLMVQEEIFAIAAGKSGILNPDLGINKNILFSDFLDF